MPAKVHFAESALADLEAIQAWYIVSNFDGTFANLFNPREWLYRAKFQNNLIQ